MFIALRVIALWLLRILLGSPRTANQKINVAAARYFAITIFLWCPQRFEFVILFSWAHAATHVGPFIATVIAFMECALPVFGSSEIKFKESLDTISDFTQSVRVRVKSLDSLWFQSLFFGGLRLQLLSELLNTAMEGFSVLGRWSTRLAGLGLGLRSLWHNLLQA